MADFDCRDANNYNTTLFSGTNFYFGYDSMCIEGSLTKKGIANRLGYSCFKYACDED